MNSRFRPSIRHDRPGMMGKAQVTARLLRGPVVRALKEAEFERFARAIRKAPTTLASPSTLQLRAFSTDARLTSAGESLRLRSRDETQGTQSEHRAVRKIDSVAQSARSRTRYDNALGFFAHEVSLAAAGPAGNIKSVGRMSARSFRLRRFADAPRPYGSRRSSALPSSTAVFGSGVLLSSSFRVSCPRRRSSTAAASHRTGSARAPDCGPSGAIAPARFEILRRGIGSAEVRRSRIQLAMQASTSACTHDSYISVIFARSREARSKREIRNASSASWDDVERYSNTDLFSGIHGSLAYWVRPARHGPKAKVY